MTEVDVTIRDEGSLVMFQPRTERALDWWDDNVQRGPQMGRWRAVQSHVADAILIGLQDAGFCVGVEE